MGTTRNKTIRNREDLIRKLKDMEFMTPHEQLVTFVVGGLVSKYPGQGDASLSGGVGTK